LLAKFHALASVATKVTAAPIRLPAPPQAIEILTNWGINSPAGDCDVEFRTNVDFRSNKYTQLINESDDNDHNFAR